VENLNGEFVRNVVFWYMDTRRNLKMDNDGGWIILAAIIYFSFFAD